jgi:hypothetical protein
MATTSRISVLIFAATIATGQLLLGQQGFKIPTKVYVTDFVSRTLNDKTLLSSFTDQFEELMCAMRPWVEYRPAFLQ